MSSALSLVFLGVFAASHVYGQSHYYHYHYYDHDSDSDTTSRPTPAPTSCECLSYTAANSTYILPDGDGCTYCTGTCSNFQCTCLSQSTCAAIEEAVKSFFSWIIAAVAFCIFMAIIGCVYRCCIRPRLRAKLNDYQQQINAEIHDAVHLDHVHHHHGEPQPHPHHHHHDPHHHPQPSHAVHAVDQHGHHVQVTHVPQPQIAHVHHEQPPVTTHVVMDDHHHH